MDRLSKEKMKWIDDAYRKGLLKNKIKSKKKMITYFAENVEKPVNQMTRKMKKPKFNVDKQRLQINRIKFLRKIRSKQKVLFAKKRLKFTQSFFLNKNLKNSTNKKLLQQIKLVTQKAEKLKIGLNLEIKSLLITFKSKRELLEKNQVRLRKEYDLNLQNLKSQISKIDFKRIISLKREIKRINKSLLDLKKSYKVKKNMRRASNNSKLTKYCPQNKKIESFSKDTPKYRCLKDNTSISLKTVCLSQQVRDGKLVCSQKTEVKAVQHCIEQRIVKGVKKCMNMKTFSPEEICKDYLMFKNEKICSNKYITKPSFSCLSYGMVNGTRFCKSEEVFYGQKYHEFKCKKTGKIIKRVTEGINSKNRKIQCEECMEYEDVVDNAVKDLDFDFSFDESDFNFNGRLLQQKVYNSRILELKRNLKESDKNIIDDCIRAHKEKELIDEEVDK